MDFVLKITLCLIIYGALCFGFGLGLGRAIAKMNPPEPR